jgi:hypothetical protein
LFDFAIIRKSSCQSTHLLTGARTTQTHTNYQIDMITNDSEDAFSGWIDLWARGQDPKTLCQSGVWIW